MMGQCLLTISLTFGKSTRQHEGRTLDSDLGLQENRNFRLPLREREHGNKREKTYFLEGLHIYIYIYIYI